MTEHELIRQALEGRRQAYAPYSKFRVGAALVTVDGKVYKGCNVENAAYSPSNCAERTAFFKAVSEGERKFYRIAIVGGYEEGDAVADYATPCGVCRQVMMEFCNPKEFTILVARSEQDYKTFTLEELMPEGFGAELL